MTLKRKAIVSTLLLGMIASAPALSATQWYSGQIQRIWMLQTGHETVSTFVMTLDDPDLAADCNNGYAYFRSNNGAIGGLSHWKSMYALALTGKAMEARVGIVMNSDYTKASGNCFATSIDLR